MLGTAGSGEMGDWRKRKLSGGPGTQRGEADVLVAANHMQVLST